MILKCKNCGGNVVYNPDKKLCQCPHCESEEAFEEIRNTGDKKICFNCGAPLEGALTDYTSALSCPNCGISIIQEDMIENDFKPSLIIPFDVSREKAVAALKNEFNDRIFTPLSFLNSASIRQIEGIYVPFFLYDYDTDGSFEGTGTKVRSWSDSNYNYTETSYYRVRRKADARYVKVPVDASIKMEDDCMDLSEPFEYGEFESFEPKYMSGFEGEVYNEDKETLSPRAELKIQKSMDSILRKSIIGYTTISGSPTVTNRPIKAEYALLPIWKYVFKSNGKDYKFYVNGQTGKVVGKTPVDPKMVMLFSATVFGLITVAGEMIRLALSVL